MAKIYINPKKTPMKLLDVKFGKELKIGSILVAKGYSSDYYFHENKSLNTFNVSEIDGDSLRINCWNKEIKKYEYYGFYKANQFYLVLNSDYKSEPKRNHKLTTMFSLK